MQPMSKEIFNHITSKLNNLDVGCSIQKHLKRFLKKNLGIFETLNHALTDDPNLSNAQLFHLVSRNEGNNIHDSGKYKEGDVRKS